MRCVRRRSPPLLDDAPSCDDPPPHHGERRGPRPASSCLLAARRSRARPLLKGVEHRGIPSSRKAPNTLCHRPGCVLSWSAPHALAGYPLADQDSRLHRPPRRERHAREPGCLNPPRRNGAGERSPLLAGRPASTRRDPSRGVALVESQRWVRPLVSPSVERAERGLRRLGRENPNRSGCSPAGAGADRSARNGHYCQKLAV